MVTYRPDIDGLRALAVLAVMFFHARIPGFAGGYVGVDVFFVVSGFLITSIIFGQVGEERFSFIHFYDRRARRILPALTVVALSTIVAAWMVLLPEEFVDLGQSVTAIGAFASNVLFWIKSGYFAGPAHETPLLHTWSLAVEEQFYLVWPVLIVVLNRLGKSQFIRGVFIALVVGSLIASEWMVQRSATTAFYFSPFRAWELAIGGLLALPNMPKVSGRTMRELLSLLGFGLIAWAIVGFSEETRFPGVTALLPVVGTALILYTGVGAGTRISKILSVKPLVGLGLISYSLYLWHWPLLVLPELHLSRFLSLSEALIALVASTVLAGLTWKFIEQPFRKRSEDRRARLRSVGLAVVSTVAVAALGLGIVVGRGFPGRLPPEAQGVVEMASQRNTLSTTCMYEGTGPLPAAQDCLLGDMSRPYRSLLWGDSHADHFAPAIDVAGAHSSFAARQLTMSACPPLIGATRVDRTGERQACVRFNKLVLQEIQNSDSVKEVILAARWSLYTESRPHGESGGDTYLVNTENQERSLESSRRVLALALRDTVQTLLAADVRVVLLGQVPESEISTPKCLARAIWYGRDVRSCDIDRSYVENRLAFSNELLSELAELQRVSVYLPSESLCDSAVCPAMIDNLPLFRDRHHLNQAASRRLGYRLADAMWPKFPERVERSAQ